jgi:hypothetical protein
MKKLLSLLILAIIIFLNGCQEDKITCKILSPKDGQCVLLSKDLTVTIEATSTKSTIEKVIVFFDTNIFVELTKKPYTVIIPSQALTLGDHTIRAFINDYHRQSVRAFVTINVVESIDNNEKESPDFVTFTDGKFPNGWVTYTWELANIGYDDNYSIKSANYPVATVFTKKTMNVPFYVEFYTKGGDVDLYIDDVKAQALTYESGNWDRWIYPVDSGKHAFRWQAEGVYKYLDAITFALAGLPVVTTNEPVTSITATTAVMGGKVEGHGNNPIIARGICWSTTENPTIEDKKTINNYGLGNFSSYLTGLAANTLYYARAYAVNNVGVAYGEQRNFTTLP